MSTCEGAGVPGRPKAEGVCAPVNDSGIFSCPSNTGMASARPNQSDDATDSSAIMKREPASLDPGSTESSQVEIVQHVVGRPDDSPKERPPQMGARPKTGGGILVGKLFKKATKKLTLEFNVDPISTMSKPLRNRDYEVSPVLYWVKDASTDTFVDAMHVRLYPKRSLFPSYFPHYESVLSEAVISIARGTSQGQTLSPADCRSVLLDTMQRLFSKTEDFELTRSTVYHPASHQTIGVQTTGDNNTFENEHTQERIETFKKIEFVFDVNLHGSPTEGVHTSEFADGSESDLQENSQEMAIARRATDATVTLTKNESRSPRGGDVSPAGIMPLLRSQDPPRVEERHEEEEVSDAGGGRGVARNNQEQQEIDTILEQLREEMKCMICADHERNQIILPCSHFITCTSCTKKMKTCPFCRQFIQATITPVLV